MMVIVFISIALYLANKGDHTALYKIKKSAYMKNTVWGEEIAFVRVPGHIGIRGNSAAHPAANDALAGSVSEELVPFSDLKSQLYKYVIKLWR